MSEHEYKKNSCYFDYGVYDVPCTKIEVPTLNNGTHPNSFQKFPNFDTMRPFELPKLVYKNYNECTDYKYYNQQKKCKY